MYNSLRMFIVAMLAGSVVFWLMLQMMQARVQQHP
jgi:hypothetical protein